MKETYHYEHWSRIKSLFDQALDLSPAQRDEWLASACLGNEDIRQDVERLLREHQSAGDFLAPLRETLVQTFSEGALVEGRFRIERLIGTGGMGEVYQVEDVTIQERLALKTLRADLTGNASLISRFRRELQVSRQIAHPHVCRVFEFYQTRDASGRPVGFFTMELLKGETLAKRISSKGRLTPGEALPIIRQVAAGLTEAHRLGIVHRDLKPANIMLLDDGLRGERAVVMDFGLARNVEPGSQNDTRSGALIGTPVYMAPEQFNGGPITFACDLYSFGVTIHEMLTGRSHPLVALRSELRDLDPSWDQALLACLDVHPESRPSSPAGLVGLLSERHTVPSSPVLSRRIAIGAAVAVLLAASFMPISMWLRPPPQHQSILTRVTRENGFATDPAVSPDGKMLVYASDRGPRGDLNIWLQRMDNLDGAPTQLTDDPGNEDEPAISPDGKLVAYHSQREEMLYVKPTAGGPATALAKWAENPRFSPDGSQIAYWTGQESERTAPSGRVWLVKASGGEPRPVGVDFLDARYPAWSPDGRKVLFLGARSLRPSLADNLDWWIADTARGVAKATGAGAILRSQKLTLQGSPVAWDGKTVVFSGTLGQTTNLWHMDLSESQLPVSKEAARLTTSTDRELAPAVLADGRVAYANWRFNSHIWRIFLPSGKISQITEGDLTDARPSVSKDGQFLVFWRRAGEERSIMRRDLKSTTEQAVLSDQLADTYISPDGTNVAYSLQNALYSQIVGSETKSLVCRDCGRIINRTPDGQGALLLVNLPDGGTAIDRVDLTTASRHRMLSGPGLNDGALSPDGTTIAFTARREGVLSRIFLKRIDEGQAGQEMVAITPPEYWADDPVWSEDGRQVYYSSHRDGFRCVWRQTIHPATLSPMGNPQAIYHFHHANFSPSTIERSAFRLSLANDSLFLNVASVQSNLWLLNP